MVSNRSPISGTSVKAVENRDRSTPFSPKKDLRPPLANPPILHHSVPPKTATVARFDPKVSPSNDRMATPKVSEVSVLHVLL